MRSRHDVHPDHRPVRMVVRDTVVDDRAVTGDPAGTHGQGPRPGPLLVTIAIVLGFVGLAWSTTSHLPVVRAASADAAHREAVTDAPRGPIAHRWSVPLPEAELVTGLAVVDDVAVATWVATPAGFATGEFRLSAHDALDGRVRWTRTFPEGMVVVVGEGDDARLLPTRGPRAGLEGREHANVSGIVAVDIPNGTDRWSRDTAARPDSHLRLDRAHAGIELTDTAGVRRLDLATGQVLDRFDTRAGHGVVPRRCPGAGWSPRRPAGTAWTPTVHASGSTCPPTPS